MNIQGNAEQWEDGTFKTFAQLRLEDENAALRKRLEEAELTIGTLQADRIKAQATIDHYRTMLEAAREGWDLCLAQLKRNDKRLEAAEKVRREAEIAVREGMITKALEAALAGEVQP